MLPLIPIIIGAGAGLLFGGSKKKYAQGGQFQYIDLFEDYENIPSEVQEILDRYAEQFGEDFGRMDYKDMANMHKEIESFGYTFDSYLDNQPFGLRPIGVELNQLKGYEEFAKGGSVNYHKHWEVIGITLQGKKFKKHITLGRMSDKEDVKQALRRMSDLNIREVTSIKEIESYAKGGAIRKPKFEVGDMVYSWQNPDKKARVSHRRDDGIQDGVDYGFHYKVSLKDESGYSKSSKWMHENSMSKTKKETY
jgi:hypothetical protein